MSTIAVGEQREVPSNGVRGLKYLRYDLMSGMAVSLVSLPLSSGIAIASGVPPLYGLISAIIAGLIFPLIGGSYVTISGPAAGLAPALLAAMAHLGGAGDAEHLGEGYPHLLVVICMVGIIQIGLAIARLAKHAALIPVSVVEGMLASIGLLIIVKQVSMFCGFTGKVHAHEFYEFVMEAPTFISGMTVPAFAVSLACLVLLFTLGSFKHVKWLSVIPPQLIAVIFGVIVGRIAGLQDLGPGFLISLPKDSFHGAHLPDFAGLFARQDLWYAAGLATVTLVMIDGVESLATAMAIDRLDPWRRKSQPNRVLLAMGVCNIASSLVGGLTIIPGGVKSKANIAAGGRTLWANFTNAICLIMYLWVGRDLINMIPKGALAAVLIYTGWKMCEPLVWRHMAHIGKAQLFIFTFTIIATLATDLLWGIVAGVLAKLLLALILYRKSSRASSKTQEAPSVSGAVTSFFQSPVTRRNQEGSVYHLHVERPLVCFNTAKMIDEFERIPADVREIQLHLDPSVGLIDHTSFENLHHAMRDLSERGVPVKLMGLDQMRGLSEYHAAMHVKASALSMQPS